MAASLIVKIYEFQAKELLARFGIPVQPQAVVTDPAQAVAAAEGMGFPVVIKAQVLAGGRGKAGGVKLAHDGPQARRVAGDILGLTIQGQPVKRLLVAPAVDIRKEYYVGITLDRTAQRLILMISREGGVNIEELAQERPDAIHRLHFDPLRNDDMQGLDALLSAIFEEPTQCKQARSVIVRLRDLAIGKDCSLVEINPYAQVGDGSLMALDARITFDDNALWKHDDLEIWKNPDEYSADENDAKEHNLSFVSMEGDIGCIVNGAGLAMATMDLIKLFGGEPANFLDVGGSSNPQKVLHALRIITSSSRVRAILINIFGGITRCDDIANGILLATDQIDIGVPMVIRLIGTNEERGRRILTDAGFEVAEELGAAVQKVVGLSGGRDASSNS